jgi:hypothetical protein
MEYHLPILCNAAVEFGWSKDNVFSTSKVFYWDNCSYSTTRNPASFENKFWIILHQVQGLKFEICYFDRIKFVCLSGHWLG